MSKNREPEYPEMEEDIDCGWDSVKSSWGDAWKKSKLFVKHLPTELLDAADLYISNKVEEVKESVTSRVTRARDRIKSAIARKIISWIEFWKRIVFFKFLKRKLDLLIQKTQRFNAENTVEELRRDIGERLTGLHPVSMEESKEDHFPPKSAHETAEKDV